MIRFRTPTEARGSSRELRHTGRRLRELSRTLSDRSAALREQFAPQTAPLAAPPEQLPEPMAEPLPEAPPPAAAHGRTDVERLLRAERELEAAIVECRQALDEVRREMRRQFPASTVVH